MGFWAGFVGELNRIEDRNERRELFLQEQKEKRYNTLLSLAGKRRENQAKVKDFAGDLAWAKSRIGDIEGADEYLDKLKLNPENAKVIRGVVEDAEKNLQEEGIKRRITGEQFINSFQIVGEHLDDPDYLEAFKRNGGDPIEALLRMDPKDMTDETYNALFLDMASPEAGSVPGVSVDVDAGVYNTPNTTRAEKAKEMLDQRLITVATREKNRLQSENRIEEATKIDKMLSNYQEGISTELRNTPFGAQAYQDILSENTDMFGGLSDNPFIRGWQEDIQPYLEPEPQPAPQRPQVESPVVPPSGTQGAPSVNSTAPPVGTPDPNAGLEVYTPQDRNQAARNFGSEEEAQAARELGIIKPGDTVIIRGRKAKVN